MSNQNSLVNTQHQVLDHGFIRVVDLMGNDDSIVQAARISYGKGTKSSNTDKNLLRYLMCHQHSSPFEMCEIKLHIKLPIFVMRQWIRHRTANVNEYSARYSEMEDEFYYPSRNMICKQSMINKQSSGQEVEDDEYIKIISDMQKTSQDAFKCYEKMLRNGIARETARIILPLNIYTQMYWKIDLHNLMRFLVLRSRANAQPEIREYALVILDIFKAWMPSSYEAFMDYNYYSHVLSSIEHDLLRGAVNKDQIRDAVEKSSLLSKREKISFIERFT